MIFMYLFTIILLILVEWITPKLVKKTEVFGVSIPEPFINDEGLQLFKMNFRKMMLFIQLPLFVTFIILFLRTPNEEPFLLFFIALILHLSANIAVYLTFHKKVSDYKQIKEWEEKVEIVHVSSFESVMTPLPFPHLLFIPMLIVPILIIVLLIFQYPSLPEQIPIHWGANGMPDGWSNKSIFSVFFLPFLLLTQQVILYVIAYYVQKSSLSVKAQASEQSLQRERRARTLNTHYMAFINLLMTVLLGGMELLTIRAGNEQATGLGWLTALFFIFFILGTIAYMIENSRLNKLIQTEANEYSQPSSDNEWLWGLFYFDKENPDIFIEKKYGVGWTVNFARPATWIFLILVIFLPLLPLFFL